MNARESYETFGNTQQSHKGLNSDIKQYIEVSSSGEKGGTTSGEKEQPPTFRENGVDAFNSL